MSGPDDTFLARWSRRKQAVKAAESVDQQEAPPETAEAMAAAEPGDQDLSERDKAAAEPAEPLPNIDELTADSDITAFLRKGVPEALRKAALRKAWSLDPAIRDFVGPADYAWDFNDPGSIPGFGVAGARASLEKLAALGAATPKAAEQGPAPEPPREAVRRAAPGEKPENAPASAKPAEAGAPPPPPPAPGESPSGDASAPKDAARREEAEDPPPRPRHGGALPR